MAKIFLTFGILLSVIGCASPRRFYGGGVSPPIPRVEMTVVSSDDDVDFPPIPRAAGPALFIYPLEMLRAMISGEVLAVVAVEKDGTVSRVEVDRAAFPEFRDPVTSGLLKCTFFPAKRGGVAVRSMARCKIQFILDEE